MTEKPPAGMVLAQVESQSADSACDRAWATAREFFERWYRMAVALRRYGQHRPGCAVVAGEPIPIAGHPQELPCTCGWDRVRKEVEAA